MVMHYINYGSVMKVQKKKITGVSMFSVKRPLTKLPQVSIVDTPAVNFSRRRVSHKKLCSKVSMPVKIDTTYFDMDLKFYE